MTDDVIVVGGGVIGLTVAWRLARAGLRVRVVDPAGSAAPGDPPSRAAGWVAAGMLAPVSEAAFGEEALLRLNLAALRRFPEVAAELEADAATAVGLRRTGTLLVAADADDWAALLRLEEHRATLGLATRRLGGTERRRAEPFLAPDVRGALLVEEELSVDNRRLLEALQVATVRVGVRRETAEARSVLVRSGRVTGVRTAAGTELSAGTVVLAAGSATPGLDGLPDGLVVPVRPVKGQILRLRPRSGHTKGRPAAGAADLQPSLRRTIRALVHGREVYLVPREDGEVVVGATSEELGRDTEPTAGGVHDLLADALEVVPALGELALAECAAGLRPGTPDNGPLVGPTDVAGLIVATGHHRNGILLSALTADAVLAAVRGEEPALAWAPFRPDRFTPSGSRSGLPPTPGGTP